MLESSHFAKGAQLIRKLGRRCRSACLQLQPATTFRRKPQNGEPICETLAGLRFGMHGKSFNQTIVGGALGGAQGGRKRIRPHAACGKFMTAGLNRFQESEQVHDILDWKRCLTVEPSTQFVKHSDIQASRRASAQIQLVAVAMLLSGCAQHQHATIRKTNCALGVESAARRPMSPDLWIHNGAYVFAAPERLKGKGAMNLDEVRQELITMRPEEWTHGCQVSVSSVGAGSNSYLIFRQRLSELNVVLRDLELNVDGK